MDERSHSPTLVERGVYWARPRKKGRLMAYAVDSNGDDVKRLVLQDDSPSRMQAAVDALWDYLDLVDPVRDQRPQLRLVTERQLPSTARRARLEPLDPYNLPPVLRTWQGPR